MKSKFKQSTLKPAIVSAIVIGSTILGTQSHADTGTSIMNVSATVKHSCSIDTNPMTFGAYDGVVAHASTALEATATAGTDAGLSSDDTPIRRMTSGADNYLIYQVYSDVARETVWGNTVPTGVGIAGTGSPQTHKVYGSIPSAQIIPEGDYSDQIYVTITY